MKTNSVVTRLEGGCFRGPVARSTRGVAPANVAPFIPLEANRAGRVPRSGAVRTRPPRY